MKSGDIAVKSPEQVRAEFLRTGQSIASFAKTHNLPYATVYQVMHGQKKGLRGEAHRAAVLLGMKIGTLQD
ncbi:DNA-binding protein [Stenotrophomonas sp. B1-1]|uniref:DNA-binding protein n=1 Tax=Stenotrophomonas sp. B1-1 TaxID=2710648 RepID=UPI0013DC9319|nr:DNA-binding protein [Stenotrophomonas sp. B1-1]